MSKRQKLSKRQNEKSEKKKNDKKRKNDKKCKNCQNEDKNQMEKLVKIKQNRIQILETSYVKQKSLFNLNFCAKIERSVSYHLL